MVLNFFASWCQPCQKETPLLARTAADEQAKGSTVQFIGVDTADKPSDALPFVQRAGITYPVGVDFSTQVIERPLRPLRGPADLLHRQLGPGGRPRARGR